MSILINTQKIKRNKSKFIISIIGLVCSIIFLYIFIHLELCTASKNTVMESKNESITTLRILQFFCTTGFGISLTSLYNCFKGDKEIHRVIDTLKNCCGQLELWISDIRSKSIVKSMNGFMELIGKQIEALEEISNKDDKKENKTDIQTVNDFFNNKGLILEEHKKSNLKRTAKK